MSYSFNAQAKTKALLLKAIELEFDKVIANQPVHVHDKPVQLALASAILTGIGEAGEAQTYQGTFNGYLNWRGNKEDGTPDFTGCSASANINIYADHLLDQSRTYHGEKEEQQAGATQNTEDPDH